MLKVGICNNRHLKMWNYLWNWAVERGRKNFEMHDRKRLDCFEQIAKINMDINILQSRIQMKVKSMVEKPKRSQKIPILL